MFPLPIAGIALQLLGALSQQFAQPKPPVGDLPPSTETPPAPALPQAGGVDINAIASLLTLLHLAQAQTTQQVSTRPAALQPAPKLPLLVSIVIILVIVGFFASLAGVAATAALGKQLDAPTLVGFGAAIFAFATAVAYVVGSSLGSWVKNVNAFSPPQAEPTPLPAPALPQPPVVTIPPAPPAPPPVPPEPKPAPPAPAGPFASSPPWFRNALHEIGTHEVGNNSGADIRRYISMAHAGSEGDPWCAIFACAMLEQAGVRSPRSASSQSFRTDPNFVQLSGPAIGAVVVFWRGSKSGGLGHVGFYRGEDAKRVWTLGGNESDMVQIEALPKDSNTFGLVGYYWPRSVPLPAVGPVSVPSGTPSSIKTDPTEGEQTTTSPAALLVEGSGKGSWYSQFNGKFRWVDKGDAPESNALGVPDSKQGFAMLDRSTLGTWRDVLAPNGKVLRLQQTDIGPALRTGRAIDIAAAAAEEFGYSPTTFPTDSIFKWGAASKDKLAPGAAEDPKVT